MSSLEQKNGMYLVIQTKLVFLRSGAVIYSLHDFRLCISRCLSNATASPSGTREDTPQGAAHPLEIFREMSSRAVLSSSIVRLPSITEERFATTS